ncbi:MAG: TIM44-like domain-containing protein [Candidatus Rickettsia vulgarisii]
MLELLIFAGIAFFIINKLISKLGSTSDEDPAKRGFFGEPKIKDVTNTSEPSGLNKGKIKIPSFFVVKEKANPIDDSLIVQENAQAIKEGLATIASRLPSFEVSKFLKSSKAAFEIIIEACNDEDIEELSMLVDRRYIKDFHKYSDNYGEFIHNNDLVAKISEAYSFANHLFVKVLFTGNKVTSKIGSFSEEWTFSKSLLTNDVNWLLTNVEKTEQTEVAK